MAAPVSSAPPTLPLCSTIASVMSDEVSICETCKEILDPDAAGIIVAYQQIRLDVMGNQGPEYRRYRLAP